MLKVAVYVVAEPAASPTLTVMAEIVPPVNAAVCLTETPHTFTRVPVVTRLIVCVNPAFVNDAKPTVTFCQLDKVPAVPTLTALPPIAPTTVAF